MVIIGIDPGVTGAIAFTNNPQGYYVEDMPTMTADDGRRA